LLVYPTCTFLQLSPSVSKQRDMLGAKGISSTPQVGAVFLHRHVDDSVAPHYRELLRQGLRKDQLAVSLSP
jgi:hypothetical protein